MNAGLKKIKITAEVDKLTDNWNCYCKKLWKFFWNGPYSRLHLHLLSFF